MSRDPHLSWWHSRDESLSGIAINQMPTQCSPHSFVCMGPTLVLITNHYTTHQMNGEETNSKPLGSVLLLNEEEEMLWDRKKTHASNGRERHTCMYKKRIWIHRDGLSTRSRRPAAAAGEAGRAEGGTRSRGTWEADRPRRGRRRRRRWAPRQSWGSSWVRRSGSRRCGGGRAAFRSSPPGRDTCPRSPAGPAPWIGARPWRTGSATPAARPGRRRRGSSRRSRSRTGGAASARTGRMAARNRRRIPSKKKQSSKQRERERGSESEVSEGEADVCPYIVGTKRRIRTTWDNGAEGKQGYEETALRNPFRVFWVFHGS